MRKPRIYAACLVVLLVAAIVLVLRNERSHTPDLPEPSLKELATRHDIQIGNFAMPSRLGEKPYREILTSQFDLALVDNQPNWHFTDHALRPSATGYDFSRIDEVISFAENNDMDVQAHHYVWGEEKWLPEWLKEGDYDKQELLGLIKDHIMTVGQRYSGRVQEWTVVNEAFTRKQHLYGLNDWWADNIGDDSYIDQSFIWARQADPHSKLLLNDFQNESRNDISDAMYEYIKGALGRGVPIDGLGMQMHIDGTHPPTKDEVVSNMKRFGELGIKVYVTEFDVNMNDVKAEGDDKDKIQGDIYYEMLRACIESEVCESFAILGITDKETWYNHVGLKDPRPLPFDDDYQPKRAFFGLRRALEQE